MTQRIAKVESVVRQIVAEQLPLLLEKLAVGVTVTGVDASPDMRHAIVWVSVLDGAANDRIMKAIELSRPDFQRQVAKAMTTKYVPKLSFKLDTGGEYADHINRLLHNID